MILAATTTLAIALLAVSNNNYSSNNYNSNNKTSSSNNDFSSNNNISNSTTWAATLYSNAAIVEMLIFLFVKRRTVQFYTSCTGVFAAIGSLGFDLIYLIRDWKYVQLTLGILPFLQIFTLWYSMLDFRTIYIFKLSLTGYSITDISNIIYSLVLFQSLCNGM